MAQLKNYAAAEVSNSLTFLHFMLHVCYSCCFLPVVLFSDEHAATAAGGS